MLFLGFDLLKKYQLLLVSFIITTCCIRGFEYYIVANKSLTNYTVIYEMIGLVYDVWFCLMVGFVFIIPYYIIYKINRKLAFFFIHTIFLLLIVAYISLIIVFSERNNPFDHEFFTRKFSESWTTTKQMMSSGYSVFLPFFLYIILYFLIYYKWANRIVLSKKSSYLFLSLSFISICFLKFSSPTESWFNNSKEYYLTCNKFSYWAQDSYHYFNTRGQFDASNFSDEEILNAVNFYQLNHPFQFTSKEYPLLHEANDADVLGNFFNLDSTKPPNIVILVVEGLSRDFSGHNAYASSFTPFLDSLSNKSLTWDNFLSTAPATFAVHPAIEGSLPYGSKGFSVLNVMPNHLSLIKILNANGYHSKFLIGFNPDFDNMGGFIRLQGTDMILTKYGSKYKEMGIGEEGWSMGYPDDALFNRSFEVMDSLKQTPYLNIYHTATTHMPYLFEQKHQYEKLFDKKLEKIKVASNIKRTLKESKKVLVTFMFSDDCIKDFFKKYSFREDFKNTIFFITGDHHIGSFPSTGDIDDYHVPLIVYSPMLKTSKRFLSINSHANIAPTITSLILNNYKKLPYHPSQVNWLGAVLDTAQNFRNLQSMPFMYWSREIGDYIWQDYMLSGTQLYKLSPTLEMIKIKNDSIKNHISSLLNNFKIINSYVCNNNKIFPEKLLVESNSKKLLFELNDERLKKYFTKSSDTSLMQAFKIPSGYKKLYLEIAADINLLSKGLEDQPSFRFAIIDTTKNNWNYVFYTNHDIVQLAKGDYIESQWNSVSTNDMITLNDYTQYKNLIFDLAFYCQKTINLQMKNLKLKVYGIK